METSNNKVFLLMQKIAITVMMIAIATCIFCAFCAEGIYRKDLKEDIAFRKKMHQYDVEAKKREDLLDAEIRAEKARIQQSGQSFEARTMVFRMPPEPRRIVDKRVRE